MRERGREGGREGERARGRREGGSGEGGRGMRETERRRKGRSRGREDHYVPDCTLLYFMLHMSTGVRARVYTP